MQVTVQNENTVVVDVQQQETIVVEVDQGRAGRGIQNITYTEVSGQYFLIVTYTDGTTETLGPLVVTGGAAFLLGGATGSIPYQSAPNTTVFLPIGTQNQVVVAGATAPQYTSALTGLTVNNSAIGNTAPSTGAFTNLSASGTFALTGDQVQISEGGTGQTTANGAFNALAPSQTGNAGKYLKTDGTNSSWDQLDISTADITGTLPIANGGTGQTTANSALNALLPTQAAQSGKYLKTDGTNASWDQLDISTADITGVLPIANGGTGASTAAGARANLSAAILGTNNDITSLTGITGGISTPDFVQFDTTATEANAVGKVYWDAAQGTLDLGLLGGNVITRIGQTLVAYVTNAEAVTITKGQAVYLFGAQGNRASVKLASNLSDATSAKTFGVVAENIGPNQTGFIMCQGVLEGLNLGAYTAGDTLYLGATPGSLTATKPYAPNHLVYVGLVERANAGNGQLYVKVQNGYELDEIHDVQIINPQNGQTILYDASTSLWKNANLTAGTGISVTNGAASVTIGNTGVLSFSGGTTGLTPATSTTGAVTLGGTLAIGSGGTGQTTANASFNALAPSQTGNAGKYLKTDGTNSSWDLLDISTSDITGTLPVANGGTGATTAAGALINLNAVSQSTTISAGTGLTGGGDLSANRTLSIANTTVTAASYGSASSVGTFTVNAQGQLTAAASTPIAIANTQVSGLGTMSTQNSNSVTITGGSITGITDLAIADGGTGASDAPTARTNLGLGTSAVLNAGVALGVATLDAGGTVPLSQLPASIQGGVSYQGSWDAATNTPTIVSSVGTKGYYYVVSVAGSTNINGISDWLPGDWIIFNGSIWQKIDNTDAVASVNGYTGVVVLNAADVGAAPTSRTITTGTGLTGGGDLSANRTISIANTTVAAGSYGSASSVGTFTVNGQGQLTAAASTPIAITNTQVSGLGTMSTQNAGSVAITGGTIDGTTIGGTTRAAGSFTTLTLTNALSVANGGTGTTTSTGTGSVVLSSSPTLTTPNLGTPSAVTLTNATGLPLTTGVTGTLPIGNGGTGQTTANAAFNALAPSQTGNAGKYLTTDGTNTSWATNPLGTVTSVDVSGGTTGLTTSGGPITSSGTITLGGTLGVANGGTGTTTAFTAGSVVFAGASGVYSQNNSQLFWDNTNTRLGIGTASPGAKLAVSNGTQTGIFNPRSSAANGLAIGTDVASAGHVLNLAGDLNGGGTGGGVNIAYYSSLSTVWNAALSIRNTASTYSNLLLMQDGGNVGIGTSSPGARLDVQGGNTRLLRENAVLQFATYAYSSAQSFHDARWTAWRARGTAASPSVVQAGDELAAWEISGWNANNDWTYVGGIRAYATGTITGSNVPSYLAFETSSSNVGFERVRISNDGTFRVRGSGTAGSTDAVQFAGSAPASAMTLDSGGNLLLGQTSQDARFNLNGPSTGTSNPQIRVRNTADGSGNSHLDIGYYYQSGVGEYGFIQSFTDYGSAPRDLLLQPRGGNVGIGTSSPGQLLDVSKSQNTDTVVRVVNSSSGTSAAAQFYASNGTTQTQFFHLGTAYSGPGVLATAGTGGVYSNNAPGLAFVAANASAPIMFAAGGTTERARITSTGRLVIGNTSANQKLDIWDGAISVSSSAAGGSGEVYRFGIGTTTQMVMNLGGATGFVYSTVSSTAYGQMSVRPNYLNLYPAYSFLNDSGTGIGNAMGAGNTLTFHTNSAEAARITSGGELLVGTITTSGGRATFTATANYGDLSTGYSLVLANTPGTGTASNPINVGVLQFGNPTVVNSDFGKIAMIQENATTSTASSMRFYINAGGGNVAVTERARISADGTFRVKGAGTAGSTDAVQFAGSAPASSLVLDSSGNLMANGAYFKQAVSLGSTGAPASEVGLQYQYSSSANRAGIYFLNSYANNGAAWLSFWTSDTSNSYGERSRIDASGNLLVGKTGLSDTATGLSLRISGETAFEATVPSAGNHGLMINRQSNDGSVAVFRRANAGVGSISVTTTATAYNTSSDYRLKDNPQPLTGSGAFIDALKPKTWTWKETGAAGVGFIAHEVQDVSPGSVVGTKDAVDEEGKPIMQAMEYGSAEFIANIIAELQSLRARVAQLEGASA